MSFAIFTRETCEVDPRLDEEVRVAVSVLHHHPNILPVDLLVVVAVSVSAALDA